DTSSIAPRAWPHPESRPATSRPYLTTNHTLLPLPTAGEVCFRNWRKRISSGIGGSASTPSVPRSPCSWTERPARRGRRLTFAGRSRWPLCSRARPSDSHHGLGPVDGSLAFGGGDPGSPAGCPGPQKIVSPDRAKGVQYLTTEEESRMPAALHGPRIDLGQAYPTTRDLCLPVALVAGPRQLAPYQHSDEAEALFPSQLCQRS